MTWRRPMMVKLLSCLLTHIHDVKNNAWVTVNNDFWFTSEAICQLYSRATKSQVKIIGKSPHEWRQKSLFTVTNVLFLFLHTVLCPEDIIPLKELSITEFAIVAKGGLFWLTIVTSPQLICDVTRIQVTGIVMSYSSTVLARANWHKSDLH